MSVCDYDVPQHVWPQDAIVRGIVINGVMHPFPEPVPVKAGDLLSWRIETADDPLTHYAVKPEHQP